MKQFTKHALALLMAGTGLAGLSQNALAQEGMTVDHVSKMERVYGTEISEDGKYIAYRKTVRKDPLKQNAYSSVHLHVYNTETEEHKPFYTRGRAGNVTFRPNHNTLTFTTRQKGDKTSALYEMPVDGGGATKIMEFKSSINSYDWGSEGKRIVFTAKNPDGKEESDLPYTPDLFEEGLVHTKAYVTDVTKDEDPQPLAVEGTIYNISMAPDNEHIAVSMAPTPLVDDYYMRQDVRIVNYESQEITAEIKHDGKLNSVHWSPGGDQVALLAGNDIHDVISGRIKIADADGGKAENIKPGFKGKFEQIHWTEDDEIHFIASEGTQRSYGIINPENGEIDYTYEPGESNLMYQGFSFADEDNVSFVVNTPKHPREVYYKSGNGTPERITHSNDWLNDVKLGEQTVVEYEAEDGKPLQGILIKPLGYDGGEVPTIVVAHGGPEAHYSNGWQTRYIYPGQVAAAKGYAVFYPNYRGSTGRGIEFLKSSQGDAAGKEFDDIVDGADHLIDEGIADADKLGITGGSYGGYATGWMSTKYSDRFEAGVMNFGISDNVSKWGTTDIPQEMYLVHAREWLWDGNWMKYLKRSPIYHVDKAQTPLLITHGKDDTRVHPGQSMELYRHIKVRKPDVPVRLVQYPGEGHGYNKATARYDYNIRMMRWFDHFLMEDEDALPDRNIDNEILKK